MLTQGTVGCQQNADLVIGLVNNMPPAAMQATDRQFAGLIAQASGGLSVRVRFFVNSASPTDIFSALPNCTDYEDLAALWDSDLDGLIVTGAEPRAEAITCEPFWPTMEKLAGWAAKRTLSTIWSCLAAHAVVFACDGIRRRSLNGKLSGVFGCVKASDHSLVRDAPPWWQVPHSRYNGLDDEELRANGYDILSCAPRGGADMFAKRQGRSLFLFMQGHPEYGPDTLMREYRRDIRRFFVGDRIAYPDMPEAYFDDRAVSALAALREQVLSGACSGISAANDPACCGRLAPTWIEPAVRLYERWLMELTARKATARVVTPWQATALERAHP